METIDNGPRSFQPMNVNFGLFPPLAQEPLEENGRKLKGPERGNARKKLLSLRAKADLDAWLAAS